jgi:tetratricopeptide (TPR) repeat protein
MKKINLLINNRKSGYFLRTSRLLNGRCPYLLMLITAIFVVITCPCGSFAQEPVNTPGPLFYQANIYYQEGKYGEAVKSYEKILGMGWESGNLYYNLGNSYFKEGKFGLAVLNYDRAMGFIPNDSDLRSNYDYVLQELNLGPQSFGVWFEKIAYNLFAGVTVDMLAVILSLVYILFIAYLILSLFFSRLKRYSGMIICVFIAVFAVSAYALSRKINYRDSFAVVVSGQTEARFEPLENATVYFKLNEGSRVEIVDKNENWYKVRRFDNKPGWIKKPDLIKLDL